MNIIQANYDGCVTTTAGVIDADGTNSRVKESTVTRTAVGTYSVVFDNPEPTVDYVITLSVQEDEATADSINIHYYNKTVNGFDVWIGEGDNGTAANVLRDRDFTYTVVRIL